MKLTKHAQVRAEERFGDWEASHIKQAAKYVRKLAKKGKCKTERQGSKLVAYYDKFKFVFDGTTVITVCKRSHPLPALGTHQRVAG